MIMIASTLVQIKHLLSPSKDFYKHKSQKFYENGFTNFFLDKDWVLDS